jgi:hypothetical protein
MKSGGYPLVKKSSVLCFLVVLVASCLFSTGCESAAKKQMRVDLRDKQAQKQIAMQTIADETQELDRLKEELNKQNDDLKEYDAQVDAYMLDHKMAVAAIVAGLGGAKVAMDTDNAFSEDAKNLAATVGVVALFWAIANLDELSTVVGQLNEADVHVKTLQAGIANTTSAIQQQQIRIQSTTMQRDQLGREIADLQAKIGS